MYDSLVEDYSFFTFQRYESGYVLTKSWPLQLTSGGNGIHDAASRPFGEVENGKASLGLKRRDETRVDVKVTIRDTLYDELPEAYTEPECEDRTQKVYLHMYDNYVDARMNVYA